MYVEVQRLEKGHLQDESGVGSDAVIIGSGRIGRDGQIRNAVKRRAATILTKALRSLLYCFSSGERTAADRVTERLGMLLDLENSQLSLLKQGKRRPGVAAVRGSLLPTHKAEAITPSKIPIETPVCTSAITQQSTLVSNQLISRSLMRILACISDARGESRSTLLSACFGRIQANSTTSLNARTLDQQIISLALTYAVIDLIVNSTSPLQGTCYCKDISRAFGPSGEVTNKIRCRVLQNSIVR